MDERKIEGVGIREATAETGLSMHQLRYLDERGHLGFVKRVNLDRRFTSEQLDLARRIHAFYELGLSLDDAAAFARGKATAQTRARVRERASADLRSALERWRLAEDAERSHTISAADAAPDAHGAGVMTASRNLRRNGGLPSDAAMTADGHP